MNKIICRKAINNTVYSKQKHILKSNIIMMIKEIQPEVNNPSATAVCTSDL
jgi:hypothetical protein